jgi:hypothetical protein
MISPALVSEADAMRELMKEVSIGRRGRSEKIAAAVLSYWFGGGLSAGERRRLLECGTPAVGVGAGNVKRGPTWRRT